MVDSKHSKKYCLIATLGTEPQVITSTLDLLLRKGDHISDIVIIHTEDNDGPISSAVNQLIQAFSNKPYSDQFTLQLVPILDENGEILSDIETCNSSSNAFRTIYQQIRLAKLAGKYVHLSIAGGRKTMAVFGMVAAQLLFDEGDYLWHLYSSDEYLASKRLHPQPNDDVHLIPIPVIFWSNISPSFTNIIQNEDPFQTIENVRQLQLREKTDIARSYILESLTESERKVTALLVKEGLSDQEIGDRLSI